MQCYAHNLLHTVLALEKVIIEVHANIFYWFELRLQA